MLAGKYKTPADLDGRLAEWPRFQQEAFQHNLTLVNQVEALAKEKGCTPAQLALAWVRRQNNNAALAGVIPLPGCKSAARVRENAVEVALTDAEFEKLTELANNFQTAGDRYPAMFPTNT